ncbi:unnamed protein product [Kuraishia capsulata CBS 1993]|uniref:Rho-GAP domain-containing protein n=1 Tax=Kuraishia capsulata CBS 1993 TaxID=1382522 RepID=W6MFT2_9ASCO|nr:uncharacterized protein KUCA_T00000213001 [Kuraishia capsulata CBS 1993]CDK24253.1 unnamed protein product [Kuraishia capsulata CBS 1993]
MTAEPSSSPLPKNFFSKLKSLGKSPDDDNLVPPRPTLGFKSRSSNSVRPSDSSDRLKQQRDSFLSARQQNFAGDSKVFGVELEKSLDVAEGRIYISGSDGLVRYGRIPIVVALCGLYLKKEALDVEGIFRIGGSSKRIKQLQIIFSTEPEYGRRVDWVGYTVHDAASLLRRFLGSLPEPLVPFDMYEKFRDPLRRRPRICKYLKSRNKPLIPKAIPAAQDDTAETTAEASPEEPQSEQTPLKATESQTEQKKSDTEPQSELQSEPQQEAKPEQEAEAASELDQELEQEPESEPEQDSEQEAEPDQETEQKQDQEEVLAPKLESNNVLAENPSLITVTEPDSETTVVIAKETPTASAETIKPERETESKSRRKHDKFVADRNGALEEYANLLDQLPESSRHLLFYILDLLALFNYHADKNLMPARNLAAVFQPSILSHSDHDMSPEEYELSRLVVEFMTQYSYKLLPAAQNLNLQTTQVASAISYPPQASRTTRKHSRSLPSVTQPPDVIDAKAKKLSVSSGSINNSSSTQLNPEVTESEVSDTEPSALPDITKSAQVELPADSAQAQLSEPVSETDPFLSPRLSPGTSSHSRSYFRRKRTDSSGAHTDENEPASPPHGIGRLLGFLSPKEPRGRSSSIDDFVGLSLSPKRRADLSPAVSPGKALMNN